MTLSGIQDAGTVRSQLTASGTTCPLKGRLLIWSTSQTTAICTVANLDLKSPDAGCQIVRDPCLRDTVLRSGQHGSSFPSAQQLPVYFPCFRQSDDSDVLVKRRAVAFLVCIYHDISPDVCKDAFPSHP